jgi:hypothetical protein
VPAGVCARENLSRQSARLARHQNHSEGLGFLYHQQLSSDQIIVCLTDDTLVLGTILRQCLVHEGYRDCGVRFSRKLDLQKDAELLPHANVEAIN